MKNYILTFSFGILGACLFQALHLPIPWMLGPLVTIFLLQFFTKLPLKWHSNFRDAGLIVVGLSLGDYFTQEIFRSIPQFLPMIIVLNAILIAFSVALAFGTAKWCRIDFSTALVSSIPGGLSQLIIFAEERDKINLSIVTYFHVIRVLLVVSLVPLLLSITSQGVTTTDSTEIFNITIFILIFFGYIAMILAKRLKVPVPAFLGPLLFVLILNIFNVQHTAVNIDFVHIGQVLVGCHIGLSLTKKDVQLSKRLLIMGVISAILLIMLTIFIGYIFSNLYSGISFETAFLSLAPGGLDQMSLIALGIGGNVALVTLFQLFRILTIYIIVLPILQKNIK